MNPYDRPGITTEEIDEEGLLDSRLVSLGFFPVSSPKTDTERPLGTFRDRVQIVGYIREDQMKKGWDCLREKLPAKVFRHARLVTPKEYVLCRENVYDVVSKEDRRNLTPKEMDLEEICIALMVPPRASQDVRSYL